MNTEQDLILYTMKTILYIEGTCVFAIICHSWNMLTVVAQSHANLTGDSGNSQNGGTGSSLSTANIIIITIFVGVPGIVLLCVLACIIHNSVDFRCCKKKDKAKPIYKRSSNPRPASQTCAKISSIANGDFVSTRKAKGRRKPSITPMDKSGRAIKRPSEYKTTLPTIEQNDLRLKVQGVKNVRNAITIGETRADVHPSTSDYGHDRHFSAKDEVKRHAVNVVSPKSVSREEEDLGYDSETSRLDRLSKKNSAKVEDKTVVLGLEQHG